MNSNDLFLEDDKKPSVSLIQLAKNAEELGREIMAAEEYVSSLKKKLLAITHSEMVEEMQKTGFTEIKLPSGETFSLELYVSGSLPKDELDRQEAINVLIEHDGASIIKNEVSVFFKTGFEDKAEGLYEKLKELGYTPNMEKTVHPSTLHAWAKECIKLGEEIPFEKIGISHGQYVKIKRPKNVV